MRKWFVLVASVVVLALALVPVFAQEGTSEKTIGELVVEIASSDSPEFTLLLTVVQAADPAVLETLTNPEVELTVFAPTDAAFNALIAQLGQDVVGQLLANPQALTDILLFHVVEGIYVSGDVAAALEMTGGSATLPTLNGQYIDVAQTEDGQITINGAGLVSTDVVAANGVIHVIDAVILPEDRDLPTLVTTFATAETPEFTTLLSAVVAADLVETLANPDAFFTVFAPTDAAFAALDPATLEAALADTELLTAVLTYHVVAGKVGTADLGMILEMAMSEDADMAEMPEWFVGITEEGGIEIATVNGATIVITIGVDEDGKLQPMVNNANIIKTDVDATNGLVHVIDAVILPPMGE